MTNKEIQIEITSAIMQAMISGTDKWLQPWIALGKGKNFKTRNDYRGINVFLTWLACEKNQYPDNLWAGYSHIASIGGHVKAGEKGTSILAFNRYEKEKKDKNGNPVLDQNGKPEKFPLFFYKYQTIFNIHQTGGIDIPMFTGVKKDFNPIPDAEKFIAGIDHKVKIGSSCLYDKTDDTIVLPGKERFLSESSFYASYLHELAHWSGHKARLDRKHDCWYDNEKERYAFEELVAELSAAYLCAEIGLTVEKEQHASYLNDWIKILSDDHTAIFKAVSEAQAATDYLTELSTGIAIEKAS